MYLKRLQVQGFKTFAQKTEFLYNPGITAIVGPNGSGKSNIADAIRWVLGEQRYTALRGRKTEDVIFAGSALKPAMGFAEASITFDNSDSILPLDFNEVTITRRAYRTGENEYYINKSRVRLKDITEALMPLSQTYTIITQGMVDAALSQKPEERRGLFEDAASIGLYNLKKAEAENNLHKQEDNSRHIGAMIAEIEPRLKGLERHARQAEEFYLLRQELQTLLKRYYGNRWHKITIALEAARLQEQQAITRLEAGKAQLEELQTRIGATRAVQNEQRAELAALHRDSSQWHSRAQQLQQQVAVDQERLNGLLRQRETHEQERLNLELTLESSRKRLHQLEQEHAALVAGQDLDAGRLTEQETLVREYVTRLQQAEAALAGQQQEISRQQTRLDSLRQRQLQMAERRAELVAQQEQYSHSRNSVLARQSGFEEEIAGVAGVQTGLEEQARHLAARRKQLEAESAAATELIRQAEQKLQQNRSKLDSARSRLELLQRLQTNFTGLYGGVKSVMQAATGLAPRLSGIRGLVANLMEAPAELEVAMEVALGMHLQDVVVESFEDAEKAIAFLRANGSGRATFLPLDNLRPGSGGQLPAPVQAMTGVRGVARNLINFEPRYQPVYDQLLGRVLVVADLKVGRAALRELTGGWTIVTLGGEILRSSGAVTGGASGKEKDRSEGSVLMRERELREFPAEIARIEKQIARHSAELAEAQAQAGLVRQQLAEHDRESQQLNRQQQQTRDKLAHLRGQTDRLSHELKVREESQQGVIRELTGLAEREAGGKAEQSELETSGREAQAHRTRLEKAVKQAAAAASDEREKLGTLRTTQALAGQRLKNSSENLRMLQADIARVVEQISGREGQLAALDHQSQQLQTGLGAVQAEMQAVSHRLEKLRVQIGPLEKDLARLEQDQSEHERHWSEMSGMLLTLETTHGRAALETQRLESELENLRMRAADDLAPALQADGTLDEDNSRPITRPDPAEWEELLELSGPEAVQLAERIEQLRHKLRRIGAVNPLAMQEYRETRQRYEFLTTQLNDLEQTASALRALIEELDEVTQTRFGETFEKVAEQFKRFFGLLFNGGTAKLVLTNPDNLAETGIEILAQPPGKRQQNLALLSGGERSLTAVALLFALLEVNPTPFCVLDEVDAALDESNVGRFCETLRTLAHNTQFIVITHNRGTIEAARTIYGVSMGPESISKVISLRVDEVTDFKIQGARLKRAGQPDSGAPAAEPVLN